MIKSLKINNYALLKDVNIDFEKGFTVISGETGSGKSIMLDALALLLGKRVERFSASKISNKSVIEAVFALRKTHAFFLKKHGIECDQVAIIRREINTQGKSRAFINNIPVLLNVLLEFGGQILEMYSQHQSILLKDEIAQFALIDKLAKSEEELACYQKELEKYNQLKKDLLLIQESGSLSETELDFLQYQLNELVEVDLKIGEKEKLENEISLLENAEEIGNLLIASKGCLDDDQGVLSQLSDIRRKFLDFDNLHDLHKRVDSVLIELNDITSELSLINDSLRLDPERLFELHNRLDTVNKLLNKHKKSSLEELLDYQKDIESKIAISASFDVKLQNKKNEINSQFFILKQSAEVLNQKRNQILPSLQKDVEKHLKNLGMPFGKFKVMFTISDNYYALGNSEISFLFSANKGRPLLDISKVASGGELSRLMLVIRYISAQLSEVDTLVFDEIDAGVSGKTGSLMGSMMQEISKSTQLIAISHLPQIASKANHHLKVVKSVVNDKTISYVMSLDKEARVAEIAKLLSGKEVTEIAFENARVLLNQ